MQEYPVRSIVSEPFVNQIEMIEKNLIEVRNQPSSYYGRRNNRLQGSQTTSQIMANQIPQSQQYYKYNYLQQSQQAQQSPTDYYGYRQNIVGRDYKGTNSTNINTSGLNSAGSNFGSAHSNESSGSVNLDLGMSSVGSLGLTPTHVPQVFDDSIPETRGLTTFDPFESKDFKSGMFQPMFNSSNTILGSGYSGSSNIWGDTNKTMTSDAAVWG